MSYQEYLAIIRETDSENIAIMFYKYLRFIVTYLSSAETIALATKYHMMFLPRFEYYYPDVTWTRGILEAVSKGQQPDQSIRDAMYSEVWDRNFDAPSSNDFVAAVEHISHAFKNKDNLETVHEFAGGEFGSIISILSFERWATENPDDFILYHDVLLKPNQDKYSPEEKHQASIKYHDNLEVFAHQKQLVLSIADDIEEILENKV